jgi:tetratricopeptide (TPR) repeat protein
MAGTRKIAAILVADIVGYSRLAGADEDRTLSRLRGLRSDLIDPDRHPEETESHEREAMRVSPHDTEANVWVAYVALAKLHLGAYEEALDLYRRSKELNPNYATGRFNMAATLVELGRLDEARAEVQAALALNPGFTIRRYRAGAQSDNPAFLKGSERIIENMRKAGVPEG